MNKSGSDKEMSMKCRSAQHSCRRFSLSRDLIVINLDRREYTAVVNQDQITIVHEPAKAGFDNDLDMIVWFGYDAHCCIGRTGRNCSLIWPFEKPLELPTKYMKQAMALMMEHIQMKNRLLVPDIRLLCSDKFTEYEYRQFMWTLKKIGYPKVELIKE